jgi:hypothetical protein
MLIRISRVGAGGRPLAHEIILRVGGEQYPGLRPLPGVNVVAGVTGSGKTLLAEALWLGVVHTLYRLLREWRFYKALLGAIRAYGIRPIDVGFEVCLSDVEIPGLKREACIKTEIRSGEDSRTAAPEDAVRDGELRRGLIYALLHIVSIPDGAKWRIANILRELTRPGILALGTIDELWESCLASIALMPPVNAGDIYFPCYMHPLGVLEHYKLKLGRAGDDSYFYAAASRGEVSRALFEAAYELTRRVAKLAREELGVSVVPMLYIDDAFEGLDAAKIRSLLSQDYRDASIYAATHRLEAGAYSARSLVMTYCTKASELVEQPPDFRFALVDVALVKKHKDVFNDVYSKLLGEEP